MAARRKRRGGAGTRTRRGYVAHTRAPRKTDYAISASSPLLGKGRAGYPINNIGRARNAIVRARQHGSPQVQAAVFRAVKARYPALAQRSTIIPTRTGTGRHTGQPVGATNTAGKRRRRAH